jgi:flavin reductase (DIM6/NTAB) family NADH-FMN oxidoreductase RutF
MSIADVQHIAEADYFGIVSGKDVTDKVKKSGLHSVKSDFVDAPLIEEFPLTLECKLISYDDRTERVIGEVVNTSADEAILTNGKIDLSKFSPVTYDSANHDYIALGQKVGKAFSDGNKLK